MHDSDEGSHQAAADERLPRTLAHWLASNGLRIRYADEFVCYAVSRRREHVAGAAEHFRHFRFIGHLGLMQVCDGYMDRWANSVGGEMPIPASKDSFGRALPELVAGAKLADPSPDAQREVLERRIEWTIRDLADVEAEVLDIASWKAKNGTYRALRRHEHRQKTRLARHRSDLREGRRNLAAFELRNGGTPR